MNQKDKVWELVGTYKEDFQPDADKAWSSFEAKISQENNNATIRKMPVYQRIIRIAAIGVVLAICAYYFQNDLFSPTSLQEAMTKANTIQTLTLEDGTQVWLNENSRLEYPSAFDGDERAVHLVGEAFFDVAKDPSKPFIINVEGAHVKVLGTSFNVRSIAEEPTIEVGVATGKVAFTVDGKEPMSMLPKDKCILHKETKQVQTTKDTHLNAIAWKRNELTFKDTPLQTAFEEMERFFNVKIKQKTKVANCPYTSKLDRSSLKNALAGIQEIFDIEYTINDDQIVILNEGTCP